MKIIMRPSTLCLLLATMLAEPHSVLPAQAPSTTSPRRDAPDLTSVRAKIKAKDLQARARRAYANARRTYQHADVYNLMGFSLRKTGDYKQAYTFYRKALDFDPDHKGALEYLGELYVETGQTDKARENVARLRQLCPSGCEELADLERAISKTAAKVN